MKQTSNTVVNATNKAAAWTLRTSALKRYAVV